MRLTLGGRVGRTAPLPARRSSTTPSSAHPPVGGHPLPNLLHRPCVFPATTSLALLFFLCFFFPRLPPLPFFSACLPGSRCYPPLPQPRSGSCSPRRPFTFPSISSPAPSHVPPVVRDRRCWASAAVTVALAAWATCCPCYGAKFLASERSRYARAAKGGGIFGGGTAAGGGVRARGGCCVSGDCGGAPLLLVSGLGVGRVKTAVGGGLGGAAGGA